MAAKIKGTNQRNSLPRKRHDEGGQLLPDGWTSLGSGQDTTDPAVTLNKPQEGTRGWLAGHWGLGLWSQAPKECPVQVSEDRLDLGYIICISESSQQAPNDKGDIGQRI